MLRYYFFSSAAFADSTIDHTCQVKKTTQEFNFETGESLLIFGKSEVFPVTKLEHEDAFTVTLTSDKGDDMGTAKVSTGTLLGTEEGDVIQAQAYLTIFEQEEYLGLVSSTKSPMARSHRIFEKESEKKIVLINVDLKCQIKP